MSNKETVIAWVQQLPEDLGVPEILSALNDYYAKSDSSVRPENQDYEWPAPDLTEDEWRQFIAYTLHDELADTRQDIYTLEDGVPENEQG